MVKDSVFSDVYTTDPYYTAIEYIKNNGIANGYPDGTFKPENSITRGEFTKIIINALYDLEDISNCGAGKNMGYLPKYLLGGDDGGALYDKLFPDVLGGLDYEIPAGSDVTLEQKDLAISKYGLRNKFYNYICMAKEKSVISGYSDGTFRPDANISVGEASKIIANAFGLTSNPTVTDQNHKFKPYVEALISKKAIPYTLFLGIDDSIKRRHIAEIVYRLKADVTNKTTVTYENLIPDWSGFVLVSTARNKVDNSYYAFVNYSLPYIPCESDTYCDGGSLLTTTQYQLRVDANAEVSFLNCITGSVVTQSLTYSQFHEQRGQGKIELCIKGEGEFSKYFVITSGDGNKITGLKNE